MHQQIACKNFLNRKTRLSLEQFTCIIMKVEFEISIFQAIEILLQFKQRALSLRLTGDSNVTVYIACIWFML